MDRSMPRGAAPPCTTICIGSEGFFWGRGLEMAGGIHLDTLFLALQVGGHPCELLAVPQCLSTCWT